MVKFTRKFYIPIFIIAVFAVAYFYFRTSEQISSICPEDYPDTDVGLEAKTNAMDKWLNDFYDKNPGASLSEMAKARYQFYMDNNCFATLERYFEAKEGKADPAEMKIIRDTIKEEIDDQAMKNLIDALKADEQKQIYEKQ